MHVLEGQDVVLKTFPGGWWAKGEVEGLEGERWRLVWTGERKAGSPSGLPHCCFSTLPGVQQGPD